MTRRLCSSGFIVLIAVLAAGRAEAAVRHVALLQSFERGNLVLDRFTSVLRAVMTERAGEPVTFTEFVVSPPGFSDIPEDAIVEFLAAAYTDGPTPDLVITTGGPAAEFVRRNRQRLFTDTPLLYAAVDSRFLKDASLPANEAAVAVANTPAVVLDDILRLFPDTENLFVVLGAGPLGRFWRPELEREWAQHAGGLRILWSDGMTYAEIVQRASTLPQRSAVFFVSLDVDSQGATYPTARVLADIRAAANAPVFGAQSAELGQGLVGGTLMDIDAHGRRAADAALRILAGTPPALVTTPIQHPGPPMFDWRELQRWGVSESRLPRGSVVLFREPTLWSRFRWIVIGGVSALSVQAALIAALLANRARRRRAEQSLRESEGRFRVLANSAPVMIRMADRDGAAIDFNAPWLAFTGRTADAERGNSWLEGVHPDDLASCTQTYRRAFEGRTPYRMEYRLRRFDGEYRWLLDSGEPRFTPDRSFAGYIGSAIDITDLKAARAALSNLNRRLMHAQEQERSRVARELHDDVCQRVAVLAIDLDQLSASTPESDTALRQSISRLSEEVRTLAQDINSISHRLHSSKLKALGLAAAIGSLCDELAAHHNVQVQFVHEDIPAQLPDGAGINLFRVVQEALANAVKHSGASSFHVSLRRRGNDLVLEVEDDGRGFDTASALAASGLGLISMQERLRLVGGDLVIVSTTGAGTIVRGTVPLDAATSPAVDVQAGTPASGL